MSETSPTLEKWEGALGPQSDKESLFYELTIDEEKVRLLGPSPGQKFEYDRSEFEQLVTDGEWILANDDWENQVYHTPGGEQPY